MHTPVLLNEVLKFLSPKDQETYVDVTFGAGGYSRAILESSNCRVIALDRDENVLEAARRLKSEFGERFDFIQTKFSLIDIALNGEKVNGIVADFGVSSMQIDNPERGFSFLKDGKLDMRMGGQLDVSAHIIVNSYSEPKLAEIIKEFGEEKLAKKIANYIIAGRAKKAIETTLELATIIANAYGGNAKFGKIHPATKTFQALRIYINNELGEIETLLSKAAGLLKRDGRLVCVSFHSLEDGLVKKFANRNSPPKKKIDKYSKEALILDSKTKYDFEILTKDVIVPTQEEVKRNVRSRSAKLRALRRS